MVKTAASVLIHTIVLIFIFPDYYFKQLKSDAYTGHSECRCRGYVGFNNTIDLAFTEFDTDRGKIWHWNREAYRYSGAKSGIHAEAFANQPFESECT
jgi:hypothetical protein